MNFNQVLFSAMVLLSLTVFTSCEKEEEENPNASFNMAIIGLDDLGPTATYKGWLIVDGNPVTTGTFTVDENGTPSRTSFEVVSEDLEAATTFVLTIEPSPDNDPAPSSTHILAGDQVIHLFVFCNICSFA